MEVGLMGLERFSRQLRQGFDDLDTHAARALETEWATEPALAGLSIEVLRRMVRDPEIPTRDQDELWAAILRAYRRNGSAAWGSLLLELLAPALIEIAVGLESHSPRVDADDLQQQLALEALAAGRSIPLDRARFVKPWLMLEIRRRIVRWLNREARHARALDLDQEIALVADNSDAAWELCELRVSNQRSQDLALLYRLEVLGESLNEIGRELGCTSKAVDSLRWRARRRLRRAVGLSSEDKERTEKDPQRTARREDFGLLAG